jgi:hypothetical protein
MSHTDASELPARSSLARVVTRASLDPGYRRLLLADPHGAIFDELGIELPPTLRLRFVERDPDVDLMVVLPDLVGDASELDLEHLDAVLGGAAGHLAAHVEHQ